jgi:hypothetical protein
MAEAPKTDSQDRWSSGTAGAPPHRPRRFAIWVSVTGAPLFFAAGVAVSQNVNPSLQAPDARMEAPIGHRQPRPSDLSPDVQRDEQLDLPSDQTQPQKQVPNRRARAGSAPTIDVRKSCEISEKNIGPLPGQDSGSNLEHCLKEQQDARQEMINSWTKYPQDDKQKCINTTGFLPSYVEWLTCLEMYRYVRILHSATKGAGAGTR